VRFEAVLPEPPAEPGEPERPRSYVNGLGRVVEFARRFEHSWDYRGDSEGWSEAVEDSDGAVVWLSDPVAERAAAVFAFTANMGEEPGRAELWVNRHYALTFATGRFEGARRWARGPYALEYHPHRASHGLSGYWLVEVPAPEVTPGKPLEFRVAHSDGAPGARFVLQARRDTIEHESLRAANRASPAGVN